MSGSPDFDAVPCPIPDCGKPLVVMWDAALELWRQNVTTPEGIDVQDAHSSTWRVECHDGHVVLLPGPTGCGHEDDCACDPDEFDWSDDNRTFRPHDATRLGNLIGSMTGWSA